MNCEAYPLFWRRVFLSQNCHSKNTTQTAKPHTMTSPCLTIEICNKYTMMLRNKFNDLQEISEILTPNHEYENFIKDYLEAVAECIPTKIKAKHRVLWKTLAIRKKCGNVKTASLCNISKLSIIILQIVDYYFVNCSN